MKYKYFKCMYPKLSLTLYITKYYAVSEITVWKSTFILTFWHKSNMFYKDIK